MQARVRYTLWESAALTEIDVARVRKALASGLIGEGEADALSPTEIIRIKLWSLLTPHLSVEKLSALFSELRGSPFADKIRVDGLIIIDLSLIRREVAERIDLLAQLSSAIHQSRDICNGHPVFRGTRVPVRIIAEQLAQGVNPQTLIKTHTGLLKRHLKLAPMWMAAYGHLKATKA